MTNIMTMSLDVWYSYSNDNFLAIVINDIDVFKQQSILEDRNYSLLAIFHQQWERYGALYLPLWGTKGA